MTSGQVTGDVHHPALGAGRSAYQGLADITLGGDLHGACSAEPVAFGDGQRVRTAGAVVREAEVYDLTLRQVHGTPLRSADHPVADGLQFTAPADKARYTICPDRDDAGKGGHVAAEHGDVPTVRRRCSPSGVSPWSR
ncbi:hypothetical protein ACFYZ3_37815 [Streptomyces sp. NPDC001599]|uniref:hypothetical protein n=1 Tax=Streptomyces sp. NPDC001599 TaxID=3364591 RepID=UPI00368EC5B2